MNEAQAEAVETEVTTEEVETEVKDVNAEPSPAEEAVTSETEPEASGEPEKHELPAGVKKRFSELTRDKYTLKEEIQKRDELIAKLQAQNAPVEPVKPKFSDYDSDEEYETAMEGYVSEVSDYKASVNSRKIQEQNQIEAIRQRRAENQNKYLANLKEQESLFDDFQGKMHDPVALTIMNQFSPDLVDVIWASDKGPAITYHLATHIDEAEKIASLSPLQASYELARIESRIELPKPKTVSDAPDPVKSAEGKLSLEKALADTDDAEFKRRREAQIAKRG